MGFLQWVGYAIAGLAPAYVAMLYLLQVCAFMQTNKHSRTNISERLVCVCASAQVLLVSTATPNTHFWLYIENVYHHWERLCMVLVLFVHLRCYGTCKQQTVAGSCGIMAFAVTRVYNYIPTWIHRGIIRKKTVTTFCKRLC